ncbi:MAG TPA: glycoside hydrolase family 3 N-terminal domain-containing protein [Ktedonobacterales bacterium]
MLVFLAACGQSARLASRPFTLTPTPPQPVATLSAASVATAHAYLAALASSRQHRLLEQAANWYLSRMSLDAQLGQMLVNESDGTNFSQDMATMIQRQHISGFILFSDNYGTYAQITALTRQMQASASIPLYICTDQEGGYITRISQYFGWFPSPRELANTGNVKNAYDAGVRTGRDLQELGINTDFAPVVDVSLNGGGVWGPLRTFSTDPQVVARYASAYVQGLQATGTASALKHFPGLGAATSDPHTSLPIIYRTAAQFRQSDLVPYQALIPQGPDMIMSTDVLVPSVDPTYPAELSKKWITGVLRQQLGYDGVVVTDALWMKGISQRWGLPEAAILAVEAGDDLLIAAYNASASQAVLDGLKAAIASGRISTARIQESVRRILYDKIARGFLPIPSAVLAATPHMNP